MTRYHSEETPLSGAIGQAVHDLVFKPDGDRYAATLNMEIDCDLDQFHSDMHETLPTKHYVRGCKLAAIGWKLGRLTKEYARIRIDKNAAWLDARFTFVPF